MAVVVDFLKFFTNTANAKLMFQMLGWASPVIASTDAQNAFPQLRESTNLINQAKGMSIWLDTVTYASVAQAYLAGTEGLVNGTRTPEQVMSQVQDAAKAAKKAVGTQ
jgi:raffinose/stachyose/melibiose transport system substrate-binding protein